MKKTMFLAVLLGAFMAVPAMAAMTYTTSYSAGQELALGQTTTMSEAPIFVTLNLENLAAVSANTDLVLTKNANNAIWGSRATAGGSVTANWQGNNYGTISTSYADIAALDTESTGSVTLMATIGKNGVKLASLDGATLFENTSCKSTTHNIVSYTIDGTGVVSAAHKSNIDITVDLGGETPATYTNVAINKISDTAVGATVLGGGTSNARTEAKGASAETLAANGGDIIIGTKGQLYFTGGTLTNDIYIGGSDIYTENSAGYAYSGDLRMQGDSGVELAGNLILTDNATIVGDGNGVISGEIQGAGKNLTINVGASGMNKTMTISGGGEVNDLTVGTAAHHIGLKFSDNDFALNSLTTSGAITVDGATLAIAQDTTINTLTLNSGATIEINEHAGQLTTSALNVNGDSTINANLVIADNSLLTFTEGSVTLGCSIDFGTGTTIALGEAYHSDLLSTGSTLLFSDVESYSGLENVTVTGSFTPGSLFAVKQGNNTYNIYATPEPATATLSLLALAGLMARRRRH